MRGCNKVKILINAYDSVKNVNYPGLYNFLSDDELEKLFECSKKNYSISNPLLIKYLECTKRRKYDIKLTPIMYLLFVNKISEFYNIYTCQINSKKKSAEENKQVIISMIVRTFCTIFSSLIDKKNYTVLWLTLDSIHFYKNKSLLNDKGFCWIFMDVIESRDVTSNKISHFLLTF